MMGIWPDVRIGDFPRLVYGDDEALMQVPDELLKCVCFLTAHRGGKRAGLASGFFVSEPLGADDWHAIYAVTARHCIRPVDERGEPEEPYDSISIRLNTHEGGSVEIETDPKAWNVHGVADAAILPIAPDERIHDFRHWPIRSAATREFLDQRFFGPGEEVLIAGQLVYHPGTTRMLPVVRVGSIAALPDDPVRLLTGPDNAVLLEVRSIGGLSGSPAFLHMPESRRDRAGQCVTLAEPPPEARGGPNALLGIVHGYPLSGANDPDRIGEGASETLNTGITVIVPVERIIELVDAPHLVAQRETGRKQLELTGSARLAAVDTAGDSNIPAEFERFEDLTRKLVNTPKNEPPTGSDYD